MTRLISHCHTVILHSLFLKAISPPGMVYLIKLSDVNYSLDHWLASITTDSHPITITGNVTVLNCWSFLFGQLAEVCCKERFLVWKWFSSVVHDTLVKFERGYELGRALWLGVTDWLTSDVYWSCSSNKWLCYHACPDMLNCQHM